MRRLQWWWPAVAAMAATAVILVAPGAAFADVDTIPADVTVPVQNDPATDTKSSSVPYWMTSGDCTMYPDSTIVLSRPDRHGNATISWHATTFTSHTNDGDVWYASFFTARADGTRLGGVFLESPLMIFRYTPYTFDISIPTYIDPDTYDQIGQIHWVGSC